MLHPVPRALILLRPPYFVRSSVIPLFVTSSHFVSITPYQTVQVQDTTIRALDAPQFARKEMIKCTTPSLKNVFSANDRAVRYSSEILRQVEFLT